MVGGLSEGGGGGGRPDGRARGARGGSGRGCAGVRMPLW